MVFCHLPKLCVMQVDALWESVFRVCGSGGGCASRGVSRGAVPALYWCGEVSLNEKYITSTAL